jgi:hypothetical protein
VYVRHRGARAAPDSARRMTWADLKAEVDATPVPSARLDIPGPSRQIPSLLDFGREPSPAPTPMSAGDQRKVESRHPEVLPPTSPAGVAPVRQQCPVTPPPRSRVEQWEQEVTLLHCHTVETTYHPDGRKTVSHSSRWYAPKMACCADAEPKTDPPTPGRLAFPDPAGNEGLPGMPAVRQLDWDLPQQPAGRPSPSRRVVTPRRPRASTSLVASGGPGNPMPAESPNHHKMASSTISTGSASPDWDPQQELCSVSLPPPTPGKSPVPSTPGKEDPGSPGSSPIKTRRYKRIRVLEYISDEERD